MLYGVKFCGGCNPRYERGEFYRKIQERFEGKIRFELAREDTEYDGLLVLGGCTNCCPDYHRFKTKTSPILVWEQGQFETVVNIIED